GVLKVSGKDAAKLLQGQLTCDVNINTKQSTLGAHCNPQGRILSLFYLFKFDASDAFYLVMPKNMLPIATAALNKYALFYKVCLQDVSDDFSLYGMNMPPPTLENTCINSVRTLFILIA